MLVRGRCACEAYNKPGQLGCGKRQSQHHMPCVQEMLKRGCNVTNMLFVDIAVTSDTIHNIQNLMREYNFTDCFVTTSFESLLLEVQRFTETGQTPVILGIHASLRFSDTTLPQYTAFARECCSLGVNANTFHQLSVLSSKCT